MPKKRKTKLGRLLTTHIFEHEVENQIYVCDLHELKTPTGGVGKGLYCHKTKTSNGFEKQIKIAQKIFEPLNQAKQLVTEYNSIKEQANRCLRQGEKEKAEKIHQRLQDIQKTLLNLKVIRTGTNDFVKFCAGIYPLPYRLLEKRLEGQYSKRLKEIYSTKQNLGVLLQTTVTGTPPVNGQKYTCSLHRIKIPSGKNANRLYCHKKIERIPKALKPFADIARKHSQYSESVDQNISTYFRKLKGATYPGSLLGIIREAGFENIKHFWEVAKKAR